MSLLNFSPFFSLWKGQLHKIPYFHLTFSCKNFVKRHSFPIVSGHSPKTIVKNSAETVFPRNLHTRILDEIMMFYAVGRLKKKACGCWACSVCQKINESLRNCSGAIKIFRYLVLSVHFPSRHTKSYSLEPIFFCFKRNSSPKMSQILYLHS